MGFGGSSWDNRAFMVMFYGLITLDSQVLTTVGLVDRAMHLGCACNVACVG